MNDAMHNVQRVVIIGGTSAIAVATVREWLTRRPDLEVVLAAHNSAARRATAEQLRAEGARVIEQDLELTGDGAREQIESALSTGGDVDVVLVAAGVLGDQESAWQDVDAALRLVDVNVRGAVLAGVLAADRLRSQGRGALVLLSSVAGERVRRSNFAYGATKAGADSFYLGLGEAVRSDGVHVLVVRPGFVRSPMTAGLQEPPLSQDPSQVAKAILAGLASGQRIVWVPGAMRWVMTAMRHLPYEAFRRLPV